MTATATPTITLPDRSEVDPKDCWDLTTLYASDEAWTSPQPRGYGGRHGLR